MLVRRHHTPHFNFINHAAGAHLFDDMLENFFQLSRHTSDGPRLAAREEKEAFIVEVPMPGLAQEDVDISVDNGVLTVKAERSTPAREGYKALIKERSNYRIHRSITLGDKVDVSGIEAQLTDGFLRLRLPKRKEAQPVRIPVNT